MESACGLFTFTPGIFYREVNRACLIFFVCFSVWLLARIINLVVLFFSASLPQVRFWMCSGGSHKGSLSLSIMENSTGPEEQRRLWSSAGEPRPKKDWKAVTVPIYWQEDWYDKHLSAVPDQVACLDRLNSPPPRRTRANKPVDKPQTRLGKPEVTTQKRLDPFPSFHKCRFSTFTFHFFFCLGNIPSRLHKTNESQRDSCSYATDLPVCTAVQNILLFFCSSRL